MRRLALIVITVLSIVASIPAVYASPALLEPKSFPVADDEVLVKIKPTTKTQQLDTLLKTQSAGISKRMLLPRSFVIKARGIDPQRLAAALAKNSLIEYAAPNYVAYKFEETNDPLLSKQWYLYKMQVAAATASAWNFYKGDSIKVAVLDSGIDAAHEDLQGHVFLQKNFTGSADTSDRDGHGTHVAGIVAAEGNNGKGIAGVGYKASLLIGKVLDDAGYGTYAGIADGIIWATDNGAKVINLSLGGSASHKLLADAVTYAQSHGVVVVAAAGNSGNTSPTYPAYLPGVVSVASTDESDKRTAWSTYGSWVMVAAPGSSITSTYKGNKYATMSGTSMSAPLVSGLIALIIGSGKCTDTDCARTVVEETADPVQGTGTFWKYGRVNAYKALSGAVAATPSATPSPTVTASPTTVPTNSPTPSASPSANPSPTTTPTATPSSTPTATPTSQPTPTAVANGITVSAITMSYTSSSGIFKSVYIKVQTAKNAGGFIPGARVSIDLVSPSLYTYSGSTLTDSQGLASFALTNTLQVGTYTTHITSVSASGYTYTPTVTSQSLLVK